MGRVLVICGGEHQIPLIKKAKELGHYVLNSNLYEDSPAFKYADENIALDVRDMEGNLKYAESKNIDAVITDQNELSVKTVAYVSEKLGLPSIGVEIADLFTNKFSMRRFCEENGFLYPKYKLCDCLEDAITFASEFPAKKIIKPVDSYSSKGVNSILSNENIKEYYEEALNNSGNGKVIIEEYLEGTEFTVDSLVLDGEVFPLAISEKKHYEYNENVANELYFSYYNSKYDYDELRRVHNEIIGKSGLKFGLTHSEFKYCNGQYYLIEMAARGGGAYIASKIVPYISGVDNYMYYINAACDAQMSNAIKNILTSTEQNKNRCVRLKFIDPENYGKKIKRISGIDELLQDQQILNIVINAKEGETISKADNDSNRFGYYIVAGENPEDLNKKEVEIKQKLCIEVE